MKLVSLKNLLGALLGCICVAAKVRTFDGLADMLLIVLIGYLSVKGLVTAFSQKAYDEDVHRAQQGKILYSALFGNFAYVAGDIPVLLILLAGLLAVACPATTLLRVILAGLMLAALGYAVWLCWYVAKHKQLRTENGEWGAEALSAEEEKAWIHADLWRSVILGVFAVLAVLHLLFGDPKIYLHNAELKKALSALDSGSTTLEEIIPFEWTAVYTFDPYTSMDRMQRVTGSKSPALKESASEGMTHVVFTNRGQVAASVCAYPASIGYDLKFTGGETTYFRYPDGGYSHIEYGDEIVFEVTQAEGFVKLYAHIAE